jgi:dephospho-CoA kinase
MVVIGLTGKNCAGKDVVLNILHAEGFETHSLSDAIREELKGVPITRDRLIETGNELRRQYGPSVLADRIKERIKTDRVAINSIRNPSEIASLRQLPGFVLLGIDAPVELRFQRERARSREGGIQTLQHFIDIEQRENTMNPTRQQLDKCLAHADEIITNDGTLAELGSKVKDLLKRLGELS